MSEEKTRTVGGKKKRVQHVEFLCADDQELNSYYENTGASFNGSTENDTTVVFLLF